MLVNHRLVATAAAIAAVLATAGTATAMTAPSAAASASRARHPVTATVLPSFTVVSYASSLKVFNTKTGAAVGTLKAPARQQFDGVASGGTSHTFLAYTNPTSISAACHAYYYSFRVSTTGKPSSLTLLRSIPGSAATAIAANPGGGTYTYSAVHCDTAPPNGLIGISNKARTHTWSYDEGDDYTFSLAATTGAHILGLSLYVAGPGWVNLLLNTHSDAATVDGASRVVPAIPYAQTLAISPNGATLFACISDGRTGKLAAYNAATGKLIKVLHRWTLATARNYFCQVSADAAGRLLLAGYFSDVSPRTSLIGINPQTGATVKLPVQGDYTVDGIGAAW
jgi:hypothetical protein